MSQNYPQHSDLDWIISNWEQMKSKGFPDSTITKLGEMVGISALGGQAGAGIINVFNPSMTTPTADLPPGMTRKMFVLAVAEGLKSALAEQRKKGG